MKRGGEYAHLDATLNPALLEGKKPSELNNTQLQEDGLGEAGEANVPATADRPLAATTPTWTSRIASSRACIKT